MLSNFSRKISVIFLLVCFLTVDFNVSDETLEIIWKKINGGGIVDKIYLAKQNPNIVDNFRFGPNQAQAALDESELEYMLDVGPMNGIATANYVFSSFFNPASSGKVAVIKRIHVRANAVTTANYVNLSVRRITAASGGTQISATDIPKKNSNSVNSIAEIRYSGPTVTLAGIVDSRILSQTMPGGLGQFHSQREIAFGQNDENIVIKPGEGIVVYQEAAGDSDQRIRTYFEWEETTNAPSAQNEFLFAFPRVEVASTAGYAYHSFFNPATSGKSAVVKRVWFGAETCDTTAVYTNNISLRRTTAASGGTAITASNIPKKNTSSNDSVMEFRRSGPTVSLVGTSEARLGLITPCASAGQPHGFQMIDFQENDEKLILQQGEGIALISETVGDVDQLVRMIIEWEEVSAVSTPAAAGEYIFAFHKISNEAVAPAINTTFYTFFNPVSSGKTAVIKKIGIRNNADTTATYTAFNWRRITVASGGTQITATDVPKKNTGTLDSIMELRSCGTTCATPITATYAGTADSRLLTVNGAGTVGQIIGQNEIAFGQNEKLVLKPGEGIGFYLDVVAGDIDHYIKTFIEWDEELTTPSAAGEYLINIGPVNGSTASGYNYASFFNPAVSGKTSIIKKIALRIDSQSTALYIPMTLRRTTSASGGTQITATNVPKKNTGSADSAMDIRRTGVAVSLTGGVDSRITSVQTAGTVGSATAPSTSGYKEFIFKDDERIILQPGEGIALYQESAGDADFRVKILIEWEEVAFADTPDTAGEYLLSTGPIAGSLNSGYVYSSFFNPVDSNKNYLVKRIEIRSNRTSAMVAPGHIPLTIKKISTYSGGTAVIQANVPKKHSGTVTTTAEINYAGPTVNFSAGSTARLLGLIAPGVINQQGDIENLINYQDEFVLKPGEGIALYQEEAAGDILLQFRMNIQWSESDRETSGGSLSVDLVDNDGSPISNPSVFFSTKSFNWNAQISDAILGTTVQKIRLSNTTETASWTLSISATSGITSLWEGNSYSYDFNGLATTGRLQVDASGSSIIPQSGCANTGLTKGSATYFIQGSQDAINILTAGGTAQTNCYWDITGVNLLQDIPASQSVDNYLLGMTLTAV